MRNQRPVAQIGARPRQFIQCDGFHDVFSQQKKQKKRVYLLGQEVSKLGVIFDQKPPSKKMPRKRRPGVDDDEWEDAASFGALVRRAHAQNFRSKAFQAAVRARHAHKSLAVLRRLRDQMGGPRDAASGMYSSYAEQWSWASVPMHLTFTKPAAELREERAVIARHNSTFKVLSKLVKEKERAA